jgi:hypothetical protein
MRKPKQEMPRLAQPPRKGSVPRKRGNGGGSGGPAPKKAHTAKYCKWSKAAGGSFKPHNTSECCRFDREDKEIGRSHKPFDSAKKPWKMGGGNSGQMAHLTKKLEKLKKKLKKSKKFAKKRARDLSGNSSNSD